MAKKKKAHKKVKISAKVQLGQQKKKFRRRLWDIVVAAGAQEAYKLLNEEEHFVLFMMKLKPFRVEPDEGEEIHPQEIKALNRVVKYQLQNLHFSIMENGPKITLDDYFIAGETLRFYLRNINEENFAKAPELKKGFAQFMKVVNEDKIQEELIFNIAYILDWALSQIVSGYYFFKYHKETIMSMPPVIYNGFQVKFLPTPTLTLTINGNKRTVFKLGYPSKFDGVCWLLLSPESLNITTSFADLKIEVYIQKHAITRLTERLDCIDPILIKMNLLNSIMGIKIVKNKAGQSLIEFTLQELKVGYLVYEYIEGVVVIRTFLLLTNNGTPEGDNLHDILGLEKMDKQYLGIDKLSCFVNSNLKNNTQLMKAFTMAGVSDLFNISDIIGVEDKKMKKNPNYISDYINLILEKNMLEDNLETPDPQLMAQNPEQTR